MCLNHCHLINDDYLEMLQWNANINKNLQEIRINPIFQFSYENTLLPKEQT